MTTLETTDFENFPAPNVPKLCPYSLHDGVDNSHEMIRHEKRQLKRRSCLFNDLAFLIYLIISPSMVPKMSLSWLYPRDMKTRTFNLQPNFWFPLRLCDQPR